MLFHTILLTSPNALSDHPSFHLLVPFLAVFRPVRPRVLFPTFFFVF